MDEMAFLFGFVAGTFITACVFATIVDKLRYRAWIKRARDTRVVLDPNGEYRLEYQPGSYDRCDPSDFQVTISGACTAEDIDQQYDQQHPGHRAECEATSKETDRIIEDAAERIKAWYPVVKASNNRGAFRYRAT